jgi:cytidylate kinase
MVKGLQHGVEHQMRFHEILTRVASEKAEPQRLGPYISVSRQYGSGGAEVATKVARKLGWSTLDRELVDELAHRLDVSPKMLELMDETRSNWFRDSVLNLLEPRLVEQHSYVGKLGRVMLLAAYEGRVVVVGRGANFLLPAGIGLRTLVVAPRDVRLTRLREREQLDQRSAERLLDECDDNRADFIRRNFASDVNDPRHYDLVLDSSAFGIDGSADLICQAFDTLGL